MNFHLRTVSLLLTGSLFWSVATAQESSSTGGGSTGGASSSSSTSSSAGSSDTGGSSIAPTSGAPSSTTTSGATTTTTTTTDTSGATPSTGAGTAADAVTTTQVEAAAPPPVEVRTGYGGGSVSLTPGMGRFTEKPFKFRFSVSHGYDDNVLTTPDVQAIPEPTPKPTPILIANPAFSPTPTPVPYSTPVIPTPGVPEPVPTPTPTPFPDPGIDEFINVTPEVSPTPETVIQERVGSMITKGSVGVDVAFASGRTVLTADGQFGVDHYWDRPTAKKSDYVGSFTLAFSRRVLPRFRVNGALTTVYQTNPDFSLRNAPTTSGGGSYWNTSARLDASYSWSSRITSVGTYNLSSNLFTEAARENDNLVDQTLGHELRYLWSPRLTTVLEYRYGISTYNDPARDMTSQYLLLGLDNKWSSRFSSTLRIGQQYRQQDATGKGKSAPRFELSLSRMYGKGSVISLNTEYGLDNSTNVNDQTTSLRGSLGVNHVLTPRLIAYLSGAVLRQTTEYEDTAAEDVTETNMSVGGGLRYSLSRRITLRLDLNYIKVLSSNIYSEYDRSLVFFGASYEF